MVSAAEICLGQMPSLKSTTPTQSVRQNYTSVYSFDCNGVLCHTIATLTGCQWFSTVLSFSNEKLNVQE